MWVTCFGRWRWRGCGNWHVFFFFFEHFAHFHFRSHLQTLINRESHQIKLYQSQRCRRQATGTDTPNATLSCHLFAPLLTHSPVCQCLCVSAVCVGMCWEEHRGQRSVGMTSAATIMKGQRSGGTQPSTG